MKKSFDHLLRETLQGPAPEPDGCLDAGVLAAWFEGTLDPGERAVAEAHAADCSRCQAALAAMIRSEPPSESRPWWRSPAFGWLVPITVAAAALVLFVQPYWHRTAPQVAVQHAPAPVAAPPEQAAANQAAGPPPRGSVGPNRTPAPAAGARSRDVPKLEAAARRQEERPAAAASPAAPPPSVPVTALKDRVGAPVDELTLQKAASAAAAAPAPPAASEGRSVIVTGPPPAAAGAPARPAEDQSARAKAMTENGVAETLVLTARTTPTPQPGVVVRSPDGSTQWRIIKPGSVQRSNDAGATWETQVDGVNAVITSGAAPSNSVCWLVGKSGVVLQSTDGRSWRRVRFPRAVDLISVVATDATTATVTTAAGRSFTTTDGGRNWK